MLQLKPFRWFVVIFAVGLAGSSNGQIPRSPYYSARPGIAQLTDARLLKGKFYYHRDPLSDAVCFYYYSKGTSSQQIIPVTRFKTLTICSRSDTAKHYTFQQRHGKLFLGDATATQQELTRKLFSNL